MPTPEPSAQVQEPEVITKGDADVTDLQTKEDERQDPYQREEGGRQADRQTWQTADVAGDVTFVGQDVTG